MEYRDLVLLARIAEAGSFRRAADGLQIEVSTISRRIAALEDELGVAIFDRSNVGARLTNAGRDVLRMARRALRDLDNIRTRAAGNGRAQAGELRIATQVSTLGPKLRSALQTWRGLHSEVALELIETDDRDTLSALRDRRADAGVLFTPTLPPTISFLELWYDRLVLAVATTHPLAGRGPIRWQQIKGEPLLVRGWEGSQVYRELQASLIGSGSDFRSHNAGLLDLLNLVAIGEGAMIVCESLSEVQLPGVVYVPIAEPNACIGVALAWTPNVEDPVLGSFVAFMRERASRTTPDQP